VGGCVVRFWLLLLAMALLGEAAAWADPVPGLGVLVANDGPTVGEAAARRLGEGLGATLVRADGGALVLDPALRVLWWHAERMPLDPAMLTEDAKKRVTDWVAQGHGLFLSGTALAYVESLGLEPCSPRIINPGGNGDAVVAAVSAAAAPDHPIYGGIDTRTPCLLTSAGFPFSADFCTTGGPMGGAVIGEAAPDSGEHPVVEYACGKGRIIVLGWRLPFYGLADNTHAANLSQLTRNILSYLASGQYKAVIADGRLRAAAARLKRTNAEAVRLAVEDLRTTFGASYDAGQPGLDALARIPAALAAVGAGEDGAVEAADQIVEAVRRALLASPLLAFERLMLIKRGAGQLGLPQNWESNSSIPANGYDNEIAVLSPVSPDGELTTLFAPDGGRFVGDVDLSFDASRILFSMPDENLRWRVYELALGEAAPLVLPLVDEPDVGNYDACYLSDGDVIFTSTAPFVGVPCVTGASHVANLYRLDRRTGAIRQLTFEQDHDWCPTMMPDGRLLYLRWEYTDIPHFVSRILFTMRPDGTDQRAYYGSNSYWPNAMFYARPLPNDPNRFIAIVGGHHDNPRMGELVLFDATKGRHEADGAVQRIPGRGKRVEPVILDGLTQASWPKFLHPYPLSDKYFLVSCKPSPAEPWGIYLADVFDNLTLVKEVPGYALLEATPIRPSVPPPVLPGSIDPQQTDAQVYLADVYAGPGLRGVPRGTVRKLRLVTYHFAYHGMGGQVNRVGLDGPWDIKRVLGTVPVEEDGSAYFRVPANMPVSVQPLDGRGQALQLMRSWMVAMPGETLSCVGCHERPSDAPASTFTLAARRAPSEIREWYGPVRGFSFEREVQPVLDRYCVGCHDGAVRPDGTKLADLRAGGRVHPAAVDAGYNNGTWFPASYMALRPYVRGHTIESDIHLLPPGEFAADTTHLVQLLDRGHHGVRFDDEAWDRLITWIDLNTPAHGTWHEIVGSSLVEQTSGRRRTMLARYANRDEDPEAVLVASAGPIEALIPEEPPRDDPPVACDGFPLSSGEARARQEAAGPDVERTVDLGEGVALRLRLVPAGRFVMGDSGDPPRRAVGVDEPFYMGVFEVTNAQYAQFDPAHDSRLEHGDFLQFSTQERGYPLNGPEQPVCHVSWDEATAFCRWLSERTGIPFSLPTEAQWEYPCRAGSGEAMWYGRTEDDFATLANLADVSLRRVDTFAPWSLPSGAIPEWRLARADVNDGFRVSAPVGSFQPNAWGLYDMAGNVAEWTLDVLGGPAGERRVVRGGSWYDRPELARSAHREAYPPYRGVYDVGFRVVMGAK